MYIGRIIRYFVLDLKSMYLEMFNSLGKVDILDILLFLKRLKKRIYCI